MKPKILVLLLRQLISLQSEAMKYCVAASGFNTKTFDNPPKLFIQDTPLPQCFITKTINIPPKRSSCHT